MARSLPSSIEEQLADFLNGTTTLDEFKVWLVGAVWYLDRSQSYDELRLVNEIKLALADHSGGFRTDTELRDELEQQLRRISPSPAQRRAG